MRKRERDARREKYEEKKYIYKKESQFKHANPQICTIPHIPATTSTLQSLHRRRRRLLLSSSVEKIRKSAEAGFGEKRAVKTRAPQCSLKRGGARRVNKKEENADDEDDK